MYPEVNVLAESIVHRLNFPAWLVSFFTYLGLLGLYITYWAICIRLRNYREHLMLILAIAVGLLLVPSTFLALAVLEVT